MTFDNFESISTCGNFNYSFFRNENKAILIENFSKLIPLNDTLTTNIQGYKAANLALFKDYENQNTYRVGKISSDNNQPFLIIEPDMKKYFNSNIEMSYGEIKILKFQDGDFGKKILLTITDDILVKETISSDAVRFECYDKEALEFIFKSMKFENNNALFIDLFNGFITDKNILPDLTISFNIQWSVITYEIAKTGLPCFSDKVAINYTSQNRYYPLFKAVFESINIKEYFKTKDFCEIVKKVKILQRKES